MQINFKHPITCISLEPGINELFVEEELVNIISSLSCTPISLVFLQTNNNTKKYFVFCGEASILSYLNNRGYDFKIDYMPNKFIEIITII